MIGILLKMEFKKRAGITFPLRADFQVLFVRMSCLVIERNNVPIILLLEKKLMPKLLRLMS